MLFRLLSLILTASAVYAATGKLPVPRYVSIRAQETNLRVGPGETYPVAWRFVEPNIPVEITAEFDTWRKIRDVEGTEGWVHQSLLSGNRYGVVNGEGVLLLASNHADAVPVARIQKEARVRIVKCDEGFCKIKASGYTGWVPRDQIWGHYSHEQKI